MTTLIPAIRLIVLTSLHIVNIALVIHALVPIVVFFLFPFVWFFCLIKLLLVFVLHKLKESNSAFNETIIFCLHLSLRDCVLSE